MSTDGAHQFWSLRSGLTLGAVVAGVIASAVFGLGGRLVDLIAGDEQALSIVCPDGTTASDEGSCPEQTPPPTVVCSDGTTASDESSCPEQALDRDDSSKTVSDDVGGVSLNMSQVVDQNSWRRSWASSLTALTSDIAAYELNGDPLTADGVVFNITGSWSYPGDFKPWAYAQFNLGRDYEVLTTTIGLTDNSLPQGPVLIEIIDANGPVLYTETLSVGETHNIEVPVADVLRLEIRLTLPSFGQDSWFVLHQPRLTPSGLDGVAGQ